MIGTTATIASCIFSCIFGFQNFKRSPSFPITKKARAKPERPMLEAPDFQCRHFRYVNILSICQTSKKKRLSIINSIMVESPNNDKQMTYALFFL